LIIYDLQQPFDLIILIPQFLNLAGIMWTLKYFSIQEFLGTGQIFRWFNKEYNITELDERLTLKIEGPYQFCRHPLYLFSILFLCFRPEMDLFYLTALICIIIYFYIGSIFEEKKLVERFGNKYIDYQKSVPRIFPVKFKRYNSDF
jgi:protein-S-isoprenylcysteine O-methyltransferase Ste14